MTTFYFTATGNCLAIAKRIGGTLISIPQVVDNADLHFKDNAIGVVFPVFSNATPRMVREFLDKAQFEADYTFAVGTYGNLPGACMFNLQKRAAARGRGFDYAGGLLMVDNFLPVFEMEAEAAKLPEKKTEEMTAAVVADIHARKHLQAKASLPLRALAAVLSGTKTDKNAQGYLVNEKCNLCGTCAKVCPAKNIAVAENVQFSDHCEGCLACAQLCPQNAIHLKNEKSDKRWRNPEVSLKEIIEANNRLG